MAKPTSVISLDPIDRKKKLGLIGKLMITRWFGGKKVTKTDAFGHYMFCGPQRQGKTASVLWYAEMLRNKYMYPNWIRRKILKKKPMDVKVWSNFGAGRKITKNEIFKLIDEFDPYANEVRLILIDEIHTYFPKDGTDKETKQVINDLNAVFSQLGKRNTYVLSTAQVYGRLDKALREQCLFMVDCSVSATRTLVNAFIPQDDIIADDLGRWSGRPKRIYRHGLSKMKYDTKKIIRE